MKRASLLAGLLGACAIAGFAAAGPLPTINASDDQTGSIGNPVPRDLSSNRVYCFIGATGDLAHLHRGWVCIQESAPESS